LIIDSTLTPENYDRVPMLGQRRDSLSPPKPAKVDRIISGQFRAGSCRKYRRMTDHVEILTIAQREQWIAAHRDAGLPSQSWHYAWALSASGIEPKLAVVHSSGARMLLPFYLREWQGTMDIATILGTAGASISRNSPAPLSLWREYAIAQGWVAGYIQLSTSVDFAGQAIAGELVDINEWFVLDLDPEHALESVACSIRQKIRYADQDGSVLVDDRRILADNLKRLYPLTMRRVGARQNYDFSPETLDRWVADPSALVLGAGQKGEIDAVSVFMVSGDQAEYHLNASSDEGRDLAAWLIWNAGIRLKAMGVRQLHLGGGVRRGDGLHQFKQRFGGIPKALQAVRQIYDRPM
jgi:hypothetical protein